MKLWIQTNWRSLVGGLVVAGLSWVGQQAAQGTLPIPAEYAPLAVPLGAMVAWATPRLIVAIDVWEHHQSA